MTKEDLIKLREEKNNLILKLNNEHQALENKKQEVFNAVMELSGQLKLIDELINDLPKNKTDDIIEDKGNNDK